MYCEYSLFTNAAERFMRLKLTQGHKILKIENNTGKVKFINLQIVMNAIINLNHFCEIHGPQTIFSTQTMRDKSLLNNSTSSISSNNNTPCYGCGSIGNKVIFMTEDKDSSIMFVSSEKSIFGKDNQNSLITLRSLSCEVFE